MITKVVSRTSIYVILVIIPYIGYDAMYSFLFVNLQPVMLSVKTPLLPVHYCGPATQYYSKLSDSLPVSAARVYSLTTKLSVWRQSNVESRPHPSGMHDETNNSNANTTINITSRYTNVEVTECLGLATRSLDQEHSNLPLLISYMVGCSFEAYQSVCDKPLPIKYVLCNLIFTTSNK